jgi:diadenosine tetraphosphate (Ap4A) HIT family hydrolase
LGLNDGPAAGQTMLQLHFHVIPRYTGDVPDPLSGIRHVIPSKARYWPAPDQTSRD